jgi:hypothetical protein
MEYHDYAASLNHAQSLRAERRRIMVVIAARGQRRTEQHDD